MSRRTLVLTAGLAAGAVGLKAGAASLAADAAAQVARGPAAAPSAAAPSAAAPAGAVRAGAVRAAYPAATLALLRPAGYREAWRRPVAVDGEASMLLRHVRADGRNAALGGEHFSAVLGADGRLKGLARMELSLAEGPLPSREDARRIARAFLAEAAPDLLPGLRESWIEPHDEPLRATVDGRERAVTLTGMKVKMRDAADGRWFWVIVGADRRVMVFERDVVWITFPGRRQTEKWLHDSWLAERGLASPGA